MEDDIFDTPEKKAKAVIVFESLQAQPGWQLIVKIVNKNIEYLKKQLLEGVEGETKEDIQRLRDKIKDHENFINTPIKIVKSFTDEAPTVPESDPYDK
jgi:hypothetical protein